MQNLPKSLLNFTEMSNIKPDHRIYWKAGGHYVYSNYCRWQIEGKVFGAGDRGVREAAYAVCEVSSSRGPRREGAGDDE
ncbi:hypothetical protein D3C76_1471870 [compost metagenome]